MDEREEARVERVEAIREQMNRDADIMRGLGGHLSAADMASYGERMDYAMLPSEDEMREYYEDQARRDREAYEAMEGGESDG